MTKSNGATFAEGARRMVPALFALLLLSGAARADTRADAKRHFREGMALIAAGQVERGIAELKQAYAIKPHPDVLYDIAKAYVDLGKIPDALNYFRQYVATDPEDKENVQSVMARLEAAIGGPAQPAVAQPAAQNLDVQKLLAQLQALIAQQQQAQPAPQPSAKGGGGKGDRKPAGAVPAAAVKPAHPEDDMFEAETISARTRATARELSQQLSAGHVNAEDDMFDEQVVTASARGSSEIRAPASLTIISAEEIRMSGATTVPEVLRRVPGMDVAEMDRRTPTSPCAASTGASPTRCWCWWTGAPSTRTSSAAPSGR